MILFEKKYQTFDTVFHHQMKHREESWKYDAQRSIFDELRGVSSGDETLHLMFDILLITLLLYHQLTWYNSLWLWRWLPHRLLKRQSLSTTVLFRTTFTQMIKLNLLLKWLLGSNLSQHSFLLSRFFRGLLHVAPMAKLIFVNPHCEWIHVTAYAQDITTCIHC